MRLEKTYEARASLGVCSRPRRTRRTKLGIALVGRTGPPPRTTSRTLFVVFFLAK